MKTAFKKIICAFLVITLAFSLFACGKTKTVEKTELGLTFVIPENYVRRELLPGTDYGTYKRFADIEYGDGDTFFFADVITYSELELTPSATIQQCTNKILELNGFGGTNISYDEERKSASFDSLATEDYTESYYSYITVLLGKNNVYVARYACIGAEKAIKKFTPEFAKMSASLSAK